MARSKNTDLYELSSEINARIGSGIGIVAVKEVLNVMMEVIADELYAGKIVRLQKLGTFDSRLAAPRKYKSQLPRLKGKMIEDPAKFVPTFKFAKPLKDRMKSKKAYWRDEEEETNN